MNRSFIRRNITSFAIIIFFAVFSVINFFKPSFLYDKDGAIRHFGINSRNKTVVPMWFLTILLAFASYLFVLYYLALPRLYY
jgi:hypothetical protein